METLKKIKRIASALFAALFLVSLAGCVKAKHIVTQAQWDGDFCYSLYDDGTAELISYVGSDEVVYVPAKYNGRKIIGLGTKAFEGLENLRTVYLPDSVGELPPKLFCSCPNLVSIYIPYSVKKIGKNLISDCPEFREVLYQGTPSAWDAVDIGQVPWTDNYVLLNADVKKNQKVPN